MQGGQQPTAEKPVAAFVLSLLAGLWMLGEWGMGGWMWGHGMMRGFAPALWWPWFGLIAGIIVLIGAAMLYAKPEQRQTWGIVIIIASALNFFVGMGGLVAGALSVFVEMEGLVAGALGVIGGALALSKG